MMRSGAVGSSLGSYPKGHRFKSCLRYYSLIVQLVEQAAVNRYVTGSSPVQRVAPKPRDNRFGVSIAESNIGKNIAVGFGSKDKRG